MSKKIKLLWLDDVRNPKDDMWNNYIAKYIGNPLEMDITWVKDYDGFILETLMGFKHDIVSFDHDLGDVFHPDTDAPMRSVEKTGYHACKYLVNYCIENNEPFPKYHVHSSNPVGKKNIESFIENFLNYNY